MNIEFFIHIGYHKTASTFLQQQFFPFIVDKYIFLNQELLELITDENTSIDIIKHKIYNKINNEKNIKVLISNEALSGSPEENNKKKAFLIADKLHKGFPNAKIIIIIRNQFDYLLSYYTYRVAIKGAEYRTFKSFIENMQKNGLIEKLKYSELVEYYVKKFEKQKVLILPVELLKLNSTLFFNALNDYIKYNQSVTINTKKKINASTNLKTVINIWRPINYLFSISIKILTVIFRPRKKYPFMYIRYSFYKTKRFFTPILNKIFKNSKKINFIQNDTYKKLYKIYADDNYKLQQYLNFNLKKLNYPSK